MNNQSEKPGYGNQLRMGATSLTEAWDADARFSQNHFMLGQIMVWFYHGLAGIEGDSTGPGFKKIIIKPQPADDLSWVKASFDSIRGKIISCWNRADGAFDLSVGIPANTTATVFVPARSADEVSVNGMRAAQGGDAKFLRQEKGLIVFQIPSGDGSVERHINPNS